MVALLQNILSASGEIPGEETINFLYFSFIYFDYSNSATQLKKIDKIKLS